MNIHYYEQERVFKLDTPNTSYLIGIVDNENFVGHIYYGKKLQSYDVAYLMRTAEGGKVPSINNRDRLTFYDSFPMEYPTQGIGDFRLNCFMVRSNEGHRGACLHYKEHEIISGKPKLEGLPATFGKETDCTTLILICEDEVLKLQVKLFYTIFHDVDVITRSVQVSNQGNEVVYLEKVLSCCLDMDYKDYELITMHGSWARERHMQRRRIGLGHQGVASVRGETSHQEHPFLALVTPNTTQETGEVYAMHFVYSGNFIAEVAVDQFDSVRMIMGIHPEGFTWKLNSGEVFLAPEVVMTYSASGLDTIYIIYIETI